MRRRSKHSFRLEVLLFNGILQVGEVQPGSVADLKNKALEQRPLVSDQALFRSDVIECANGTVDTNGILRELRENLVVHMCIQRRVWGSADSPSADSLQLDIETALRDGGWMIVTRCHTGLREPETGYLGAQAGEQVRIFANTLTAGGTRNMSDHYVYAEVPRGMTQDAEGAYGPRGWFPVDHLGLRWPEPEEDVTTCDLVQ